MVSLKGFYQGEKSPKDEDTPMSLESWKKLSRVIQKALMMGWFPRKTFANNGNRGDSYRKYLLKHAAEYLWYNDIPCVAPHFPKIAEALNLVRDFAPK